MKKVACCSLFRESFLSFAALLTFTAFLIEPICSGQQIRVDNSVQVSAANAQRNHYEVIIAASPSNPRHLLACSMVRPAQLDIDSSVVAYVSFDGGTSWSNSLEVRDYLTAADPFCVLDRDGSAYFAALGLGSLDSISGPLDRKYPYRKDKTLLYGSTDGGKTWSLTSTLPQADREFLTVDGSSGRIYLTEQHMGTSLGVTLDGVPTLPLAIYESSDRGKSFQTGAVLQNPGGSFIGGYPGGILPDGTFVTSFSYRPKEMAQIQGRNAGTSTPGAKVRVLQYNSGNAPGKTTISVVNDLYTCNGWANSATITSLAVDSSTGIFRGRTYVAWPDSRSGRCEILLSWSGDRGKTWSKPIAVNDDHARKGTNSGPDDFHPVVAISPKGVVGVFWYDRRDNPDNLGWRPRFSASLDGGQTFLPSVGLGDSEMSFYHGNSLDLMGWAEPFEAGDGAIRTTLAYEWRGITGGETAGLAADASGAFHPLWVDNRSGIRQVWTARITVVGTVTKNGANDLASLDDVSGDVTILFSNVKFDKANQTITADAYVENRSNSNLRVPLKVRVLRLASKIGVPEFTNADNHQGNSGAVFDFSSLVSGGILQAAQRSRGKQIEIHLDRMISEIPAFDYHTLHQMVTIDSVVLGMRDVGSTRSPGN